MRRRPQEAEEVRRRRVEGRERGGTDEMQTRSRAGQTRITREQTSDAGVELEHQ